GSASLSAEIGKSEANFRSLRWRTTGETALHVIPFRCVRLDFTDWRSLSAKTRANHTRSRQLAAQPSHTPACGLRTRRFVMKIVIIGGTGLIGSKTAPILRQGGHEVVAASPNTGVNTITGQGLKEAMAGTQVVIDLANSPSFEDKAVLEFFEASGRNVHAAEAAAGVRHHVAVSIVGTDRTPENGYFRAKVAQ